MPIMMSFGLLAAFKLVSVDSSFVNVPVIVSPGLGCIARVKYEADGYTLRLMTRDSSWQLCLQGRKPNLDFALSDRGQLAVMGGGEVQVFEPSGRSWRLPWPGKVVWIGPYLAAVSENGITLYTSGFKPVGDYEMGLPAAGGQGILAGIRGQELVIYGKSHTSVHLGPEPVRFVAVGDSKVFVAFPEKIACFDLRAKRLWDRDLGFSTSALSFGDGLVWVAGSRPERLEASLVALNPENGSTVESTVYKGETEPAFVSRISCQDGVLKVFVSKVLYTYEVRK